MNRRQLTKFLTAIPFIGIKSVAGNEHYLRLQKYPIIANWDVEYIDSHNDKIKDSLIVYFDKEFDTFVRFEKYTTEELNNKISEMESVEGFFRGKIYTNGSNRFGILACCYTN